MARKKRRARIAVYFGNRRVYAAMAMAANSMAVNGKPDRILLGIEDDEFPYQLPKQAEIINVSNQEWFPADGPNYRCQWSYMTMMRVAAPLLLPDVDRALILDVDTVVEGDLSGLWDMDLQGAYFAAAREPARCREGFAYHNCGVLLMDFSAMRDGKAEEVIGALNRRKFTWPDQDALNELCQGRICPLPPEYNVCDYTEKAEACRIRHYAAVRQEIYMYKPAVTRYRVEEEEI